MIQRDWHSFLEELLQLPALHAVQQRIRQEQADMSERLRAALMPLAYTRPSQLAFGVEDTPAELYQETSHSLRHVRLYLSFVQTYKYDEDELRVLTSYMNRVIETNTLPVPGECLNDEWREFFKELRQIGHMQAVLRISDIDPYARLGHSHLVSSTIKDVLLCGSLPRMVAVIDKALAAGS